MSITPLEIIFWSLLFLVVHCYIIFPVTLPFVSEIFRRKERVPARKGILPKVSIVVSAYNEESVIEAKIQNFLELDYPRESMQILIGDDGSTDKTAEIVARYEKQGITLVKAERNAGKAAMLNRLQKIATGKILVFCDANTMLFPNVIRKLVAPFDDEKMGCACGHLILTDKSGSPLGSGERSYWDLESEIKKFEGVLDRLIGGNGALYAIRNELYTELPTKKSVMDDFFITVKILQKGFFCTFIPSAIGTEQTSKEGAGEYRRKVRIGRANYNYLFSYLSLLNPFHPVLAYLFFSHKFLRWFTPHIGIAIFIVNLFLLSTHKLVYFISLGLMLAFLFISLTKLSKSAYYFILMNFAVLKGSVLAFKREKSGGWKREARGDEPATPVSKVFPVVLGAILTFGIASPSHALTADVSIGSINSTEELKDFNIDMEGHWWYGADQMVFLGLGVGYERFGNVTIVPCTGSLWVRLPIGSVVLPVGTFDLGYAFGDDAQMIWRAGGGLDIKNGKHSSIILVGGYQNLRRAGDFVYLRAGLLLEL
ncbi:MAG: glycosyltransferase family 2 protein [Fibrobacteraceae bacterium]|nr:glycosyltransferase family 2 protein [Fibrobacteraceae bacterium]